MAEQYRYYPKFGTVAGGLLLMLWGGLFVGGLFHYSGSSLIYTLFSFVFLAMLASGLVRQVGYGYVFLVVMLWLGFWLKVTVHLWLDYPYLESIGLFNNSGVSWDEVLLIASAGSFGVIACRFLFPWLKFFGHTSLAMATEAENMPILKWYIQRRRFAWYSLVLFCAVVASINSIFGIMQVGLVPRTIFPWPLNAFISWLIGAGISLGIATLLWWDIIIGRSISLVIYAVLVEGFISAVSTLSRGAFVFHVIPQAYSILRSDGVFGRLSKKNSCFYAIMFVVLLFSSILLSNALRENYYNNGISIGGRLQKIESNGSMTALKGLLVDRWIGIEGLMVVDSYPSKNMQLFWMGMQERRAIGQDTMYVEMSRPKYYGAVDKGKYEFTEIPGAIAFLFYSGSVWIVIAGMFMLTLAVLGSELLVLWITSNPILCSLWGMGVANMVAQMGVAPRTSMIPILETAVAVLLIGYIQSAHFSTMIRRVSALAR